MNRENKLLANILIFATGSIGSKMIQFILIPFYTGVLNPSEYGTVDMLQTVSMLLIPIFSLTISESVFRYGMDDGSDKREVFSIGLGTVAVGGILMIILSACGSAILKNMGIYIWLVTGYSICNMLRTVTSQFLRAIGKVKLFAIDNMIQTTGIVVLNLILLLGFNMGIEGYMIGYIGGNLLSAVFGFTAGKLWNYVRLNRINKSTVKKMLLFCTPLIPNTICWWISSSTDRMMLVAYVGTAANGLYSIAHKIPSVITIIVGIFIQAWQISANEEFDKDDTSEFYTKIFEMLVMFSFLMASVLMLFSKLEIRIITNSQYYESWNVMVVLIVGMAFYSFAQFLGTIYTANKKTGMAMWTNLIGAVINVIFNALLIPMWGALGAAVATSFSYLVLWLTRVITTQKIVYLKYDLKKIIMCSILLISQAVVQIVEIRGNLIIALICTLLIVIMNKKEIKQCILMVRNKFRR